VDENIRCTYELRGPGSTVGIPTGYGLDGPGIESRWGRDFPHLSSPGAHPASCTMGTGSFPGVKSSQGMMLTPYSLLVPWSWKSRAIPLLPLWAIRPVQRLGACKRAHFTLCLWTSVLSHKVTNFLSIRSRQKCKNQGGTLPKYCTSNYQVRLLLLIPLNTFIFFVIIQAVVWILLFYIQNQVLTSIMIQMPK
jgi:hypothetical protein